MVPLSLFITTASRRLMAVALAAVLFAPAAFAEEIVFKDQGNTMAISGNPQMPSMIASAPPKA
ncbi:hypothetical protein ACC671_35860, partial [Rhizobium ruizarguesonis]